jgi:hypothetical protein
MGDSPYEDWVCAWNTTQIQATLGPPVLLY